MVEKVGCALKRYLQVLAALMCAMTAVNNAVLREVMEAVHQHEQCFKIWPVLGKME